MGQSDPSGGAFQRDTGSLNEITREPHRGGNAQHKLVASRDLDLVGAPRWTEYAYMLELPSRSDERDRLFGRVLTGLGEWSLYGQLITRAKELLDGGSSEVDVPGRDRYGNERLLVTAPGVASRARQVDGPHLETERAAPARIGSSHRA